MSVAVLPFVSRSADRDTTELADGLTDDIAAGLSRFDYLNVLARALVERLAREETGGVYRHARYAIDGNVRRAGQVIRIRVTLVDTHTGSNVWTSTYDRGEGRPARVFGQGADPPADRERARRRPRGTAGAASNRALEGTRQAANRQRADL